MGLLPGPLPHPRACRAICIADPFPLWKAWSAAAAGGSAHPHECGDLVQRWLSSQSQWGPGGILGGGGVVPALCPPVCSANREDSRTLQLSKSLSSVLCALDFVAWKADSWQHPVFVPVPSLGLPVAVSIDHLQNYQCPFSMPFGNSCDSSQLLD